MHTAFLLEETIMAVQEWKKKAFVAFLDIKKAFDTVWHEGLLHKLSLLGFPKYIWIILHNWYRGFTSAVLWNSSISRSFKVYDRELFFHLSFTPHMSMTSCISSPALATVLQLTAPSVAAPCARTIWH